MAIQFPTRSLVSHESQSMIARPDVPRSTFINSWTWKGTFDAGYLIPFLVDEILPGDHMRYRATAYLRMSTPIFPLLDEQRVETFFFFVPCRLLWSNWQKFMGQQETPGDSIAYTIPQVVSAVGGFLVGSVFDYMGIPTVGQCGAAQDMSVNALPLRAYRRIYWEWFQDENSGNTTSLIPITTDGPESVASYPLRRRNKSHDYFTTCLPWPQKFTAPTVALGGTAPVRGLGSTETYPGSGPFAGFDTDGNAVNWSTVYGAAAAPPLVANTSAAGSVYADLAASVGVSINVLRQAFLVQQLLERDARGGTRYTEVVKAHFGVTSPDARLQRSEYIGGGSSPMNVTPIAQTAPTVGLTVGALGAAATGVGNHEADYAATEHGYVIGLINVRTELSYSQGLHRMWTRLSRYDFYFPALAQLGEQAVLRREIFAVGDPSADDLVFGYQERFHELRTRVSEVTSLFRPYVTGNIDEWHMSQMFTPAPVLGPTFLQEDPPMTRVLAAGALSVGQQYLCQVLINRTAVRPLPVFGTPVQLGRF